VKGLRFDLAAPHAEEVPMPVVARDGEVIVPSIRAMSKMQQGRWNGPLVPATRAELEPLVFFTSPVMVAKVVQSMLRGPGVRGCKFEKSF
jgi:hypothetical protein